MARLGGASLPVILAVILLFGLWKKVPVFDAFLEGAREGLTATASLLPTLIGLILAVSMLRASGFLELLSSLLAPVTERLGLSSELVPLMLLRPVSGSGATAYAYSLLQQFGPDSETGRIASVLTASTETTFYAVAVYFGACGYRKLRYTIPAALLGDAAAIVFSVLTVRLLG